MISHPLIKVDRRKIIFPHKLLADKTDDRDCTYEAGLKSLVNPIESRIFGPIAHRIENM